MGLFDTLRRLFTPSPGAARDKVAIEIDLAAGDVLLIDNTRVMHGRNPFTDQHRRVLTMCTFVDAR